MSDVPPAQSCRRTILIADIVGSTELYERLGDAAAREMVASCLEILRTATNEHRGTVVKHLGDGMLCSFASEEDAVVAAIEMCERNVEDGLAIRIGVNCGDVIEEDGDVFGDAVNTAAGISGLAKPLEILISSELEGGLPDALRAVARRVPPLTVKGKRRPLELFAILGNQRRSADDSTETLCLSQTVVLQSTRSLANKMVLGFAGQMRTLMPDEEVTLGRDSDSGLTVPSRHVSRLHARVLGRRGRFVLVDQSANGTYLIQAQRSKLHLIREEAILDGSGEIYLGVDPSVEEVEPIRYRIF